MSRPWRRTLPPLEGRSPERRLIRVLLPAPFGPITACSSPTLQETDTSRTAASPPKKRVSSYVSRIASGTGGFLVARSEARETAQSERHHRESADDRANQRTHAAQDHHHQHRSGQMPAEHVGIDHAELRRRQVTRHAGEHAGQHETGELVAESGEAERTHPALVDVNARYHLSERGAQHRSQ